MRIDERILTYLSVYGKENKYRLARALKIDVWEVTKALKALEEEGRIEIKGGRAIFLKGKKSRRKKKETKQPKETEEAKREEEQPEEFSKEVKEEGQETFEGKAEEVRERIEGTVKFYNPDRGFGFITGDDGKEYYIHKSGLKEGVTIEADNRVSFKVVQDDKSPRAEEVEWISQA